MNLKKLSTLSLTAAIGFAAITLSPTYAAEKAKPKAEAKAEAKPAAPLKATESKIDLPKPDADGFVELFNGKDLTNWEGYADYWSVKDAAITASETKDKSRQTFLILKAIPTVSDFELRYKYRYVSKEGNSGVQFRSKVLNPDTDPYRVGGYQADCDADNTHTGIIYDEAGVAGKRGIMSKRGEKTHWTADPKPKIEPLAKNDKQIKEVIKAPGSGEWNDCVLIAKGNHITYSINGVTTTELIDENPKAVKDGILALQCHAGYTMEIQFKDIKIKELKH
jgi:hypothetical protein